MFALFGDAKKTDTATEAKRMLAALTAAATFGVPIASASMEPLRTVEENPHPIEQNNRPMFPNAVPFILVMDTRINTPMSFLNPMVGMLLPTLLDKDQS
jgi:hypothetical protein